MTKHERFEYDVSKASENLQKHGVSFDEAELLLADPFFKLFHVEELDADHSEEAGEERWITTGTFPTDRRAVYRVVWTPRKDDEGPVTRLITIRWATQRERTRL